MFYELETESETRWARGLLTLPDLSGDREIMSINVAESVTVEKPVCVFRGIKIIRPWVKEEAIQDKMFELFKKHADLKKVYLKFIKAKYTIKTIKWLREKHKIDKFRARFDPLISAAFILTGKEPDEYDGVLVGKPVTPFKPEHTLAVRELLIVVFNLIALGLLICPKYANEVLAVAHTFINDLKSIAIRDFDVKLTYEDGKLIIEVAVW